MGLLDDPLGPVDDVAAGVTDGAIDVVQGGAGATGDVIGGSAGFIGGGLADGAGSVGSFLGDAVIGTAETGSEVAGEAGEGVGNFAGGALNGQTLVLLVAFIAVLYVFLNSEAGANAAGAAV